MRKHLPALWLFLMFIVFSSFIGHMELKLEQQKLAWQESEQALAIEQEKLQLDIIETREQLAATNEQLQAQNLLIWDIRERLHFDLGVELEK